MDLRLASDVVTASEMSAVAVSWRFPTPGRWSGTAVRPVHGSEMAAMGQPLSPLVALGRVGSLTLLDYLRIAGLERTPCARTSKAATGRRSGSRRARLFRRVGAAKPEHGRQVRRGRARECTGRIGRSDSTATASRDAPSSAGMVSQALKAGSLSGREPQGDCRQRLNCSTTGNGSMRPLRRVAVTGAWVRQARWSRPASSDAGISGRSTGRKRFHSASWADRAA
jgi:hypothetical protein